MAETILTSLRNTRRDIYDRVKYTALDFSKKMTENFVKTLTEKGHADKIQTSQGDATALGLRGNTFHAVVSNEIMDDLPKLLWTYDDGLKEVILKPGRELLQELEEEYERQLKQALQKPTAIKNDETRRENAERQARERTAEKLNKIKVTTNRLHPSMKQYLNENDLYLIKQEPGTTLKEYIRYHAYPLNDTQPYFKKKIPENPVGLRTLDVGAINHAKEVMRVLKPQGIWLTTDYITGQYREHPEIKNKLSKYTQTLAYTGIGKYKNETSNVNSKQVINAVKESGGRLVHADQQGYFAKKYAPKTFKETGFLLMPTPTGRKEPLIPHFFTFEFKKNAIKPKKE